MKKPYSAPSSTLILPRSSCLFRCHESASSFYFCCLLIKLHPQSSVEKKSKFRSKLQFEIWHHFYWIRLYLRISADDVYWTQTECIKNNNMLRWLCSYKSFLLLQTTQFPAPRAGGFQLPVALTLGPLVTSSGPHRHIHTTDIYTEGNTHAPGATSVKS